MTEGDKRIHHVISLGAGVQSSTMLLMAIHGEIQPKPELAIFADTGWEPKHVYRWLEFLREKAEAAGIPILVVSKGNIKEDILAKVRGDYEKRVANPPFYTKTRHRLELEDFTLDRELAGVMDVSGGKLTRFCTKEYKIEPITKAIREYLGFKPRQRIKDVIVYQWRGISTDEIIRARTSKPDDWIQVRYPLIELGMNRADCLAWMEKHGYPRPPKSSCIGCPFHSDEYWRQMRQYTPDEFQEAVEFDRAIRYYPGVDGEVYLHRSMKPLEEVDLRTNAEKGQLELDLFHEECEGMCGL
jgi:hypothetical protein